MAEDKLLVNKPGHPPRLWHAATGRNDSGAALLLQSPVDRSSVTGNLSQATGRREQVTDDLKWRAAASVTHRLLDCLNSMRPSWCKKTAFTLVEMFVVIAIIGILAALLIPVVSIAKGCGKSVACKNHLHQMGVALQMYVHDDQNQYPFYLGPAGDSYGDAKDGGSVYWSSKLFPYYPLNWTNSSFHCPGYSGRISGPHERHAIAQLASYAYNAFGVGANGPFRSHYPLREFFGLGPAMYWKDKTGKRVPPVSQAEISAPSDLLAICDSLMKAALSGGDDVGICCQPFASGSRLATAPYLLGHGNDYNQLFCDGHVGAMSPSILFNPTNSATMWNYDHQPHPELWVQ